MQTKIELLLELITSYKETNSIGTWAADDDAKSILDNIANLVDDNYETLEPIMRNHGVTY